MIGISRLRLYTPCESRKQAAGQRREGFSRRPLGHLADHRRPTVDRRQLRVAPGGAADELLGKLLAELPRPVPEQALGDEDLVVDADEDIVLPPAVEGCPFCVALEDAVQPDQEASPWVGHPLNHKMAPSSSYRRLFGIFQAPDGGLLIASRVN